MGPRSQIPASNHAAMRELLDGYRVSQLVCVAAELGIADLLNEGPKHYAELARATASNADALHRLLRALCALGVFSRMDDGRFGLNALAECLRSDVPGSLRGWALAASGQCYNAWGHLGYTVRTGETAFDFVNGTDAWKRRIQDPVAGRAFNDAMSAIAAVTAGAVLEVCDFSRFEIIVDVGGGQGTLIAAILETALGTRGVLFDLAPAIETARPLMAKAGLAHRCELITGNFFESVPGGGDAYILCRVIHDWNDQNAVQILSNVRRPMNERQKLLIIERIMDLQSLNAETTLSDVNMLVMNGGRERTEAEFERLLHSAGFDIVSIIPTRSLVHIIEAVAV
jgi:hypothetical protein